MRHSHLAMGSLAAAVLCWGLLQGTALQALWMMTLLALAACLQTGWLQRRKTQAQQTLECTREDERSRHVEELQRLEQQSRALAAQTQKILDSVPVPVYYLDDRHCFLGCNDAFVKITGLPKEAILGQSALEVAPPKMAAACRDIGESLLRHGGCQDFEGTLSFDPAHPRQVICHKAAWKNDLGRPVGIVATLVDITERKAMEQQVFDTMRRAEETNRLLESLIETAPAAIITLDMEARVTRWNQTAEKIFGYSEQEVLGQRCPMLPPDFSLEDYRRRLAKGPGLRGVAVKRRAKNGEYVPTLLSTAPLLSPSGDLIGSIGIMEDISELKKTEAALEKARDLAEGASRAKSQFVANVSHELRTPMNGIIGMTDLLSETTLDEEQRDFLEMARTSARSLLGVLNDILDFAKIEAGKLSLEDCAFPLSATIEETLAPLKLQARAKGLEFNCSLAPDLPTHVSGDAQRFKQILINLVSNAIKFTQQGMVCVEAENDSNQGKGGIQLRVSDTGIGIAQDQLERIFESFAQADGSKTRKFGGTGLGLAISKELVGMMNGRILARSQPGEGSVFHIHLPLRETLPVTPTLHIQDPALPSGTGGLHVLLAEDNKINQQLVRRILEKRGHQVRVVSDGRAALEAILGTRFDLVIMDVQMPVMNGIEATGAIRAGKTGQANREIPIIALTAHAMEGERERMLAAGMTAYQPKPLKAAQFAALVESVCSLPGTGE